MFFVLSTGRSGTKTIAKTLSKLPNCTCLHEPRPELIIESSAYRYRKLDHETLKNTLLQTRRPKLGSKIYAESNQTLSLIIPVLADAFPNAKFVWLIRNGLQVVASTVARQWYTGHSSNHNRYEDCPQLEKDWIDGRILGDLCGDVPINTWSEMDPFSRCCWYWSYINRTIEQDLLDNVAVDKYRMIRLEQIDTDLLDTAKWLGLETTGSLGVGHYNQANYTPYHWRNWTDEERLTFLYWCGPLMDRFFPDWRIESKSFFQRAKRAFKKTDKKEAGRSSKQPRPAYKQCEKTSQAPSSLYFTPKLPVKPRISVYITSYNQKKYFIEAIESVLAQTLKPDQIIVVDDGSTDGSQNVISRYADLHPGLVLPIYHKKNLGVAKSRIDALRAVTGDYVTYLDGDDRFLPTKLEKELCTLLENPDAYIAYSNLYYLRADGARTGMWVENAKPPVGYVFPHTFARRFPKRSLFRMELVNYQAWKAIGFHDPNISIYEDYDMRIRLTKYFQVVYHDEPLSEIRLHGTGLSSSSPEKHLRSLDYICQKNRHFLWDLSADERIHIEQEFEKWVERISHQAALKIQKNDVRKVNPVKRISRRHIKTAHNKRKQGGVDELGSNMIFVISQPRAGSTLLQRLLAGHPDIHTTGESWIMLHPLYALKQEGISTEYQSEMARQGLEDFLLHVPEGEELYIQALRKMGSVLYNRMTDLSGKSIFLDKTPRYYLIIPELYRVFPNAKFLFLLRNPIAVISSVLATWFGNNPQALVESNNYIDVIKGPKYLVQGIRQLGEDAIVIHYEKLVQNPRRIMQHAFNRIGIPFPENILDYGRFPAPKGRFGDAVGIHKHVRPVNDYVTKWLENLAAPNLVEFSLEYLSRLGPEIISRMGYSYNEIEEALISPKRFSRSPLANKVSIEIFNQKGQELFSRGDFEGALDAFKAALEENPKCGEVHNNLGVLYYSQGMKEKAVRCYQMAVQLNPKNTTFQKNLADFYYAELDRHKEATEIYLDILSRFPQDIETLIALGRIAIATDRHQDANSFFQKVLELEPTNDIARDSIARLKPLKKENLFESELTRKTLGSENAKKYHKVEYLVSAIVSTYNSERFIRGCLEDLELQTISNKLEIVVVNSGSNQNERAIVKEFQKKHPNIKYIETDRRETVYAAWNRGIKVATGKYITNANTDDRHRRNAFEVMTSILETLPEVALVYADLMITEIENETFENCTPVGHFRWLNWDREKLLEGFCFMGPQPMWRKSVHDEYGYFDDSFVTSGDYEFWLRVSQTHTFLHIPAVLGLYLKSPNSIEHANRKRQQEENEKTTQIYRTAQKFGKIIRRHETGLMQIPSEFTKQRTRNSSPKSKTDYRFSIIIPVLNRTTNLRRCIDSIKESSPEKHEIILVQNDSKKNTRKWLNQLAKENPKATIVRPKGATGVTKCCNEGIKVSAGQHIILLCDDVIVPQGWLSRMLECINSAPEAGIVGPMTNIVNGKQIVPDAHEVTIEKLNEYTNSFTERNRYRRVLARDVAGFCMLLKRDLIEKIGLLDENLGGYQCAIEDFCLRAAIEGYHSLIAGDVFVYNKSSTSPNRSRKKLSEKWPTISTQEVLGQKLLALNALEKARRLNEKGQTDKAVDILLKCIGQFPKDRKPYYSLAEMLIDDKQFKDALDVLNEMSVESFEVKREVLIGYCKEGMQQYDEAEDYANRALKLNQNNAPALNLKGILAYRRGDSNTAESLFKTAIASDPGYGETYANLGTLKWTAGEREAALDLYEKGFILSPSVTDITTLYHSAITKLTKFERAEIPFREAVGLYPENKQLKYFFIDILIQKGKRDLAMKNIEEAIIKFGLEDGILPAALKIRKALGPLEINKSSHKKNTISLCMIVKNEEKHLAKCLSSVKPVVDEMIVVDTGSNDRTKDIANAFGAQVYDFEWTGDFSKARNFSLSKASGDWILILDADEVISPLDYELLKRTISEKPSNLEAYQIVTRNYVELSNITGWVANEGTYGNEEAGTGWYPNSKVRLFSNDGRIQFENRVHELLEPALKKLSIKLRKCGVVVHHYGKLNTGAVLSKGQEYFNLGKKKLENNKSDLQALTELAVQAVELGKYEEAIEIWQSVIRLKPDSPEAFQNLGFAYIQLGKYKDALVVSEKAMELNPNLKESVLNYSLSEFLVGDVKKARAVLEELTKTLPEYPPGMAVLSAVYFVDGSKEKGLETLNRIRKMRFNCAAYLHDTARRLISAGRDDYATILLNAAVETNNANTDILSLLSRCFKKQGGRNEFSVPTSKTLKDVSSPAVTN